MKRKYETCSGDDGQCENDPLDNYPVCTVHARTRCYQLSRPYCVCDACNPEMLAAPIVNVAQLAWAVNSILSRPLPAAAMREAA